ncbi:hypothetical protein [Corynebacterium pacaense]|uniref:hypothetical protein n=1 Tax=Corynebacterium pacaense TaxID=1816684 RepID=UPI0009BB1847|nr:hypothetical protein [Corynebacterium pacaense]
MSYDFILFETDGDPGNARISKSPLTERIDFATPRSSPLLTDLAAGLGRTAPVPVDVQLSGDRCLYVVTSYDDSETVRGWLTDTAIEYGLGLADMNADLIIVFGDEDTDAVVRTEKVFSPGFSAFGLPHLLMEVLRLKDSTLPYLRVTRDDTHFIQTLYQDKSWLVERADGPTRSTQVRTLNEVIELIDAWFSRADPDTVDWRPA